MKIIFEVASVDEFFDGCIQVADIVAPLDVDPILTWDELGIDDDQTISASASNRVGPLQRIAMMQRWKKSGQTRSNWTRLTNAQLVEGINTVASSKGISVQAFGDGKILEQFFKFLSEHWDEIFKVFLSLIGL